MIEGSSAVTLATHEMPRAVRFYRALGLEVLNGAEGASFTSFRAGPFHFYLTAHPPDACADFQADQRALGVGWGRPFFPPLYPGGPDLSFALLCQPVPGQ